MTIRTEAMLVATVALMAMLFAISSTACGSDDNCRAGAACQQDSDCPEGDRCNLALAEPRCQPESCGALRDPCADTFFCGENLVCDSTESPAICEPAGVCQNGNIEANEQCDDGNNEPADGCSPDCHTEHYQWAEIPNANGGIGTRWAPASAYDSNRGVLVVFGGVDEFGGDDFLAGTWEFDGDSFRQVETPNQPTLRRAAAMAFDSDRGVMILCGGWQSQPVYDSWEYDGHDWYQISTTIPPGPGPVTDPSMVYDSHRGVVVLLGHSTHPDILPTWEYAGGQWTDVATATPPPTTWLPGMVFDSHRGVTITFGGAAGAQLTLSSATAEYDGVDWTQIDTVIRPPERLRPGMLYDPVTRKVVMFGGRIDGNTEPMADTWVYDDSDWIQLLGSPTPPARNGVVMEFMTYQNMGVMAFGSGLGDVWKLSYTP